MGLTSQMRARLTNLGQSLTVEDLGFSDCELDDEKAISIANAMARMTALSPPFKMRMPVEGDPPFIIRLYVVGGGKGVCGPYPSNHII